MLSVRIFFLMVLLHFIADFTLQVPCGLADMKQRKWWEKQVPDLGKSIYADDWKMGLLCHSLWWSIMVCLPVFWWLGEGQVFALVLLNTYLHAVIDHMKCNRLCICLWTDQVLHFFQITATWVIAGLLK